MRWSLLFVKKIIFWFSLFFVPDLGFCRFSPKNDYVQPWFFLTKYKFQQTLIYTFFLQFHYYFDSFSYLYHPMSSNYILM